MVCNIIQASVERDADTVPIADVASWEGNDYDWQPTLMLGVIPLVVGCFYWLDRGIEILGEI